MVPPGYTNVRARSPRIFFLSWSSSHLLSSHIFFSLSLQLVTQIQGHIAGSSTPFPLRYVPSFLSREDSSLFLPSSTRIESTHAARCSQQLNPAQQYKGPDLKHKMLRWYKPDVPGYASLSTWRWCAYDVDAPKTPPPVPVHFRVPTQLQVDCIGSNPADWSLPVFLYSTAPLPKNRNTGPDWISYFKG